MDCLDNSLTIAKETNYQDVPTIPTMQHSCIKDDEVWTCPICTMEANRNTIECASCLNWFYVACEKLKEKEIKQFTENDQLEFTCSSCKQLNDNMIDEFILPRSDECTDLEQNTRDIDTNVIPRECHELNSTNEDSDANPTSKSNTEIPNSPMTKEMNKKCNQRTQHRRSEANIDENIEIDEDETILKVVANLQTTAKQKTAKIYDISPQRESTESKTDENRPAVGNQAISQQTQKPKKQKKPFKLNDTEQQLAACRAEIARLEDLNNEKDKTLATMRIRIMAADDTPQRKSNQQSPELNNLIMHNQLKIER
ncbi:Hypothetical predicted protein, partial [Mytilus galloprovincialis]